MKRSMKTAWALALVASSPMQLSHNFQDSQRKESWQGRGKRPKPKSR